MENESNESFNGCFPCTAVEKQRIREVTMKILEH